MDNCRPQILVQKQRNPRARQSESGFKNEKVRHSYPENPNPKEGGIKRVCRIPRPPQYTGKRQLGGLARLGQGKKN